MIFRNLTTNYVTLLTDHESFVVPPSGVVARTTYTTLPVTEQGGDRVQIVRRVSGPVSGLPDPQSGVVLIVHDTVRMACPDRKDLASLGDPERDASGVIVGTKNLVVT